MPPTKKASIWQRTIAPHPSITDIEQRRQSRFLATLLLLLFVLFNPIVLWVLLFFPAQNKVIISIYFIIINAMLIGTYLLNHAGRYQQSALLFIGVAFVTIHVLGLSGISSIAQLYYTALALLLSAILLSFRATLNLLVISIVIQLSAALVIPRTSQLSSVEVLFFTAMVGSTILAFIRYRSELELERQDELQELNRLKTEFLSTAAHELRTPLTSILGFSELLLSREMDPARTKHFAQTINDRSLELRRIIDSLLDITLLEGKQRSILAMEQVNMNDLVTKVVASISEISPQHRFEIVGLDALPLIKGNQARLNQVFQNLLSNAVKYSSPGSTVTIQGKVIPDFIELSVQDEGIGLSPQQLAHLFERFYRADASNTTLSGTGLGLALSKLIIESHHGQIWAESESEVGTIIRLLLPLPAP